MRRFVLLLLILDNPDAIYQQILHSFSASERDVIAGDELARLGQFEDSPLGAGEFVGLDCAACFEPLRVEPVMDDDFAGW